MNEESEQRITDDKPEKDPRRIEAGKKLAAFNKMARKKKESGDEPKEPSHSEDCESTCDNEKMDDTTKILLLLGAAGLGYYLYTKSENNVVQTTVQNNNNEVRENNYKVQENIASRIRSFKK